MSRPLRVFISSPSDVPDERLRADLIVDKLAQEFSRYFTIESYLWEHEPMLASHHFQDAIDPPSKFDIVIMILWSRLGMPLPAKTDIREYHGIDGRTPVTGTEWEYEDALRAAREQGAPDILAFRNVRPATVDALDPDARARAFEQLQALDTFWQRHFADRGVFIAAYGQYHTLEEFAARLEESLRKLIERRIKEIDPAGAPLWSGNPFRGLSAYEFEHAPVFFGRDAMVAKAAEQLAAQARAGSAFLLISGPSGSGKSSLVRAALLPRLMKPQRVSGIAFVRRVVLRPGDGGTDIVRTLADALVHGSPAEGIGLPELLGPGQDAAQLAAHLRSAAEDPNFLFGAALGRLTEAGRAEGRLLAYEAAKLILVIDQLEELFTQPGINAEERQLFVRLLAGLAHSGAIWVVATIRSDFWHLAAEIPALTALAQGFGRLDLAAPAPSELAEMIRKPALAAGLEFEISGETGLGLDAVLAEHAASAAGVLPLLSFTLDELYRRDIVERQGKVLTYATYNALGQLEGAIATRADEVVAALPASVQQAFPRVLRTLASVPTGADRAAVARAARLASFPEHSDARVLVEALTAARLLVAASDGQGPTVRLAHEALLGRWKRARDQLVTDRRDLEIRELAERQQQRWREAGGRAQRQLLLRDPDLANAVDLAKRWGDELDNDLRAFIRLSQKRARLLQQASVAAAAVFFLLAVGAGYFAVTAYQQKVIANQQRQLATEQQQLATEKSNEAIAAQQNAVAQQQIASTQRDKALATQSRLLAVQAARYTGQGDMQTGILLSLEALRPPGDVGPDRYDVQAEQSLLDALYRNPLRAILRAGASKYTAAAFVSDASMLVTVAADGSVAFWKIDGTGRVAGNANLAAPPGPVTAVFVDPARPILVFQNKNGGYFAWNFQTQQTIKGVAGTCSGQTNQQFAFDPSGKRLIVYCSNVSIFDLDTGNVARVQGKFDSFALAANGKLFAVNVQCTATQTCNDTVSVMDATTAASVGKWQQPNVMGLQMSYDGTSVLTQNYDGIQFHNSKTGAVSHPPLNTSQARTTDFIASPVANVLEAGGDSGSQVWNVDRSAPIQLLGDNAVAFLPNGFLVSSDDKKMRLWEYVVEGHTGTREAVDHADLYVDKGHTFLGSSVDARKLVTLTPDGDLYIWSSDPAMLQNAIADEGQRLGDPAAFSANGKIIVTTSSGATDDNDKTIAPAGIITVWDAATLTEIKHVMPPKPPVDLTVSSDGSRIVTIDEDDNYDILDTASLQSVKPAGLPKLAYSAAFSADGQTVALGYSKGLSLWRLADGASIEKCTATGDVGGIVWTDNGSIAYALDDGTVYILPPSTCTSQQIFKFDVDKTDKDPQDADIRSKQGLISAFLSSRLQIWNEAQAKVSFDRTREQWPAFDESGAEETIFDIVTGQRIIAGRQPDQTLDIYDLSDPSNPIDILKFQADTNDCCMPVDIDVLPDGKHMMTQWSERGAFRLRTWQLLPTIADASALAKSIVPECLSQQSRNDLGLTPEPPRWCIDMSKRPYDTPQWHQWLADKDAGKTTPLPTAN